jgi:pyruvate/2-oxoacid:ferredoxin oxidoreductase alpha subunit
MRTDSTGQLMLLSGDHAVAFGVQLCRPALIPVYPITPQTPILEKLSELVDEGSCSAEIMTVESEHSAMAAAMSAALGGVRVFTATASQGLFYMHEMLHFAASCRAPLVMVEVNRSHSLPWAFWADHSDSLSQRDTGWVQLYCESPQEALDVVPIAYRVAETLFVPVMPVFEAVYVSHTYEPVSVPHQELVDQFLPPFPDQFRLDVSDPRNFGTCVSPRDFLAHRRRWQEAMERVPAVLREAFAEWHRLVGRRYDLVEAYRTEDADLVLVALGGVAGTAREAVDLLREEGLKVGLVKQRLVRPVPVEDLRRHLAGARKVAVIDRNLSPGLGGIIAQEVRAALQGVAGAPPVHSFVAGLGGVNISVQDVANMARQALAAGEPSFYGTWYEGGQS